MKYEVKTRLDDMSENGRPIVRIDTYLIEANLFAEAEYKALNESGSKADVFSVKRVKIDEIINMDKETAETDWYKATVVKSYTSDDGTEKQVKWYMLCPAKDTADANNQVVEMLKQGYDDFTIHTISKTKYCELVDITC